MCLRCKAVSSYLEFGSRDTSLVCQPERLTGGRRLVGESGTAGRARHPKTSPSSKARLVHKALTGLLVPQKGEKRLQPAAENHSLQREFSCHRMSLKRKTLTCSFF